MKRIVFALMAIEIGVIQASAAIAADTIKIGWIGPLSDW
jgi:hypothetical protein